MLDDIERSDPIQQATHLRHQAGMIGIIFSFSIQGFMEKRNKEGRQVKEQQTHLSPEFFVPFIRDTPFPNLLVFVQRRDVCSLGDLLERRIHFL